MIHNVWNIVLTFISMPSPIPPLPPKYSEVKSPGNRLNIQINATRGNNRFKRIGSDTKIFHEAPYWTETDWYWDQQLQHMVRLSLSFMFSCSCFDCTMILRIIHHPASLTVTLDIYHKLKKITGADYSWPATRRTWRNHTTTAEDAGQQYAASY